ncbi:testis-expressed protein 264 isoform X1 [Anser cygnoides]|uniref:testis-expressed protein 264 isoform X1 n=2 Tax=Anser cygnoides TaxID=8845 RepID=UPI0034D1B19C
MVAGALPSVEEVLTFIFSCFAEAWVLQPRGDEAVRCRWAQHPRAPGPMKHQVSIMSDWVLLGLIGVLVVLLLLTVFGFAVYSGLFTEVVVSAGSPPIGSITLAYKFRVGPYGESGQLFTDGCSISSKLCSIGVYYDNPHTVSPEKCRFAIGRILSEGDAKPTEEQIRQFQKYGFKIFSFPTPSHVVMASFPFTTPLSIHLAVNRVHPALDTYIKERKLCAHPRLEIYKEDRIYFVCPLARQGDFYVPEMKELERKSRAVAAEAEDAQTDITETCRSLGWPQELSGFTQKEKGAAAVPYPVRMGAQPPGCTSHPVPWLHPFPSHPVPSPKSLWWALHAFLLVDPSVPQLPVMPTGGPAATRSPASLNGRPLLSVLSAPLPSRRGCSSHPRAWQALGSRG